MLGHGAVARVSAYHNETHIKNLEESALNKQDGFMRVPGDFDEINTFRMQLLSERKYFTSC